MTGTDFEENLDQLAWEMQLIEAKGLTLGNPEVLAGNILGGTRSEEEKGGEDDAEEVLDVQK